MLVLVKKQGQVKQFKKQKTNYLTTICSTSNVNYYITISHKNINFKLVWSMCLLGTCLVGCNVSFDNSIIP